MSDLQRWGWNLVVWLFRKFAFFASLRNGKRPKFGRNRYEILARIDLLVMTGFRSIEISHRKPVGHGFARILRG